MGCCRITRLVPVSGLYRSPDCSIRWRQRCTKMPWWWQPQPGHRSYWGSDLRIYSRDIIVGEHIFRYNNMFLGCHIMSIERTYPVWVIVTMAQYVAIGMLSNCSSAKVATVTQWVSIMAQGCFSYLIKNWRLATENKPSTTCIIPPKTTATQKNPIDHSIMQAHISTTSPYRVDVCKKESIQSIAICTCARCVETAWEN